MSDKVVAPINKDNSLISSMLMQAVVGSVAVRFGEKMLGFFTNIALKILGSRVSVDTNEYRVLHAVKTEIESLISKNKLTKVVDRGANPEYELSYGTYRINVELDQPKKKIKSKLFSVDDLINKIKEFGKKSAKILETIYVSYTEKGIELFSTHKISLFPLKFSDGIHPLKKFVSSSYQKHCPPDKLAIAYTSNGDKWSQPIMRRPINLDKVVLTPEMQNVINDVEKWRDKETLYEENGVPFKRGYLIHGLSGTGKTTVSKIISRKFGMTIRLIDINSDKMTDTTFKNLVASAPPHTLLVMDEADKQFEALLANKDRLLTMSGILSAFDGPVPLSHGTIIIFTANKRYFLNSDELDAAMFRKGRIDIQFNFLTKFVVDLDDDIARNDIDKRIEMHKQKKLELDKELEEIKKKLY